MKLISLSKGKFSKVDDDDFHKFGQLKWYAKICGKYTYASRVTEKNGIRKCFFLHRVILGITDPKINVDHINHDTLDCQKNNMRPCTDSQNGMNRGGLGVNNKSGFRGVHFNKAARKWIAVINVRKESIYLGRFTDKISAKKAYDNASEKYFKEFAGYH